MPQADATGLAPEKSAEQNPPALSPAPEGFLLCAASPISMVKSRSGGLGHSNAKTARRALQILRLLGPGGIPPKPIAKLRNSPGNNVRISGGKSVTRYTGDELTLKITRTAGPAPRGYLIVVAAWPYTKDKLVGLDLDKDIASVLKWPSVVGSLLVLSGAGIFA